MNFYSSKKWPLSHMLITMRFMNPVMMTYCKQTPDELSVGVLPIIHGQEAVHLIE